METWNVGFRISYNPALYYPSKLSSLLIIIDIYFLVYVIYLKFELVLEECLPTCIQHLMLLCFIFSYVNYFRHEKPGSSLYFLYLVSV